MTDRTFLKRLLTTTCVAVAWLTPLNIAAQTTGNSTVAGCIRDTTGQPLPGVTVDVGGNGKHSIVQSDASGCYRVPDVPAGSYFVFARLEGFVSVTRDNLNAEAGQSQNIDLEMRVAPICECLAFPNTVEKLWNEADAVVRIRIVGHDSNNPQAKHRAAISKVWKQNRVLNASESLTFVQSAERNEAEPYAVGQDFVIFLKWSPSQQVFFRMSSGEGTVAAFALENGRIHSAPIAGYAGAEAERLFNELASFDAR